MAFKTSVVHLNLGRVIDDCSFKENDGNSVRTLQSCQLFQDSLLLLRGCFLDCVTQRELQDLAVCFWRRAWENLCLLTKKKKGLIHHHHSFHFLISYICWSWQKCCNTHSFLSREREEEAYSHRFGCVSAFTSSFFTRIQFYLKQKNTFTLEINVLTSLPSWILLAEEEWCFPLVWQHLCEYANITKYVVIIMLLRLFLHFQTYKLNLSSAVGYRICVSVVYFRRYLPTANNIYDSMSRSQTEEHSLLASLSNFFFFFLKIRECFTSLKEKQCQ